MLGLNLKHVSKRGPWSVRFIKVMIRYVLLFEQVESSTRPLEKPDRLSAMRSWTSTPTTQHVLNLMPTPRRSKSTTASALPPQVSLVCDADNTSYKSGSTVPCGLYDSDFGLNKGLQTLWTVPTSVYAIDILTLCCYIVYLCEFIE